jgi:hypothetical protein
MQMMRKQNDQEGEQDEAIPFEKHILNLHEINDELQYLIFLKLLLKILFKSLYLKQYQWYQILT